MVPPSLGVSSAPTSSQAHKCLAEVQPRTSRLIYGAGSPSPPHYPQSASTDTQNRTASFLFSRKSPAPTADMDMSTSCSPMQLQDASSLFFDCQDLLKQAYDPSSDPGYFSCCSSLSPTSSVDSFCFSPNSLSYGGTRQEALGGFIFSSPVSEVKEKPSPLPDTCTRKTRSRYPGKKRQTASEREKMRMRDLTKALHHLRSYLPASVVPAGQTLTKIETLRLTIRYISFLSDQLGLSEDVGDSSACDTTPEILGYFQCNSMVGKWSQGQSQKQHNAQGSTQSQPGSLEHSGECSSGTDLDQFSGHYTGIMQEDLFNSSIESFLQSPPTTQTTPSSCQMYGKHFCSQLVPDEFWG